MTRPWDSLATHRKKKRQTFDVHLTKGVSVNPKAYCCDDPEAVTAAKPPVAILTATPNPIQAGGNVTLDLNNSYDPNGGAIAAFHIWDGQGNNQAGANWVQNYPNAGRFEAMGVVTDATGLKGQASVWVDVLAGPDPPIPDLTGKKLIVATLSRGIFTVADSFATPPAYVALNNGLSGDALKVNQIIRDPWDPSNTAFLINELGFYINPDIPGAGAWSQLYSNGDLDTLLGTTPCYFHRIAASICEEGLIFAVAGKEAHDVKWIIRSENGGIGWTKLAQIIHDNAGGWGTNIHLQRANYAGAEANQGSLVVSSHDAQKLWITAWGGLGNPSGSILNYSSNKGANMATINNPAGTNNLVPGCTVPYHNNIADQIMYLWNWAAAGGEQKSPDGGAISKPAITPPVAPLYYGMLEVHTWNEMLVVAIGNTQFAISQDAAASWGAAINHDLVNAWVMSGFPYDQQLLFFGRDNTALGDYPNDPNEKLITVTVDGGANVLDKSGNLRADFNVKTITGIVPDWKEDE